uniref:Uncharacterized protein n=1 Tax=viral metagenome TaxID=1070528 RepID=A0A6C0E321_9ZZZZ
MGATASNLQNKAYKFLNCGCIYCYDFYNKDIQLLCHCYNCLQSLKNNTFNIDVIHELTSEISEYNDVAEVICKNNYGWLTQTLAIQEASRLKMRGIDEFLVNTNLLHKYGINCSNLRP